MREYSTRQTLIANVPYVAMVLIGAATILLGFGTSPSALAGAVAYVAYGLAGAVWIMVFVCPFCHFYDTRLCPCGYGQIAVKLRAKRDGDLFANRITSIHVKSR